MNKAAKYIDLIILVIIGIFICTSFVMQYKYGYLFVVNFYFGVISWSTVTVLKVLKHKNSNAFFIAMLLLSIFNIISFSYQSIAMGSGPVIQEQTSFRYLYISLNPVNLLFFLLYIIINFTAVKTRFNRFFGDSEREIETKFNRETNFYYDQFSTCNEDELKLALKNFSDYPALAQNALRMLTEEKRLSTDNELVNASLNK